MSDTTVIPARGDVAAYVAAVRSALADLPVEDVEDLTQGMEADLTEAVSEGSGGLVERFGTPTAYAAELRAAAGLPAAAPRRLGGGGLRARLRADHESWAANHPGLAGWARELAPLWWALRGVLVVGVPLRVMLYAGMAGALLTLGGVAASVWLGRYRRQHPDERSWRSALNAIGDVAGALLVPVAVWAWFFLLGSTSGLGQISTPPQYAPPDDTGLVSGTTSVTQIYAYDAQGRRLDDVRLFDQDGHPLSAWDSTSQTDTAVGPDRWTDAGGRTWTNVFPVVDQDSGQGWSLGPGAAEGMWHPPMSIDALVRNLGPLDPATTDGSVTEPPQDVQPPAPAPTGGATAAPTPGATAPTTTAPTSVPTNPASGATSSAPSASKG